ncbi:hypothetical protein F5Y10DRAFT_251047 [Nemania abortiva]|nr:hypothetical protein F5Y10DRAFT_251047 [Nemania abortiva]
MAYRPSKHRSRYDDSHTSYEPYVHSPPNVHSPPAYEYIGTDEPLSPRFEAPPQHTFSPGYERSRRQARTISPPRHSRHDRASTPPPPHTRHSTSPRPKDRPRDGAHDIKRTKSKGKHFYQNFADNNPKLQRFGKQGLTFLSEAAAAYAAAEAGKDGAKKAADTPRSRSIDRSDRYDRPRRHHRHYASSPSRSPSPSVPRRRHTTAARHSDRDLDRSRDHDRDHGRRRRYSASPPPLSRDPDSYLASRHSSSRGRDRGRGGERGRSGDHSRGRTHHHHYHSPSPSRSPSRRSRRTRLRSGTAPPSNPAADRWQMAARAALEAGGLTAFRLRKEPGSWRGGKAAKVATAAIGAAAMDAFMDQDPRASKGGMKGMAENAISSLIASQIMGKASKRRGRSRF